MTGSSCSWTGSTIGIHYGISYYNAKCVTTKINDVLKMQSAPHPCQAGVAKQNELIAEQPAEELVIPLVSPEHTSVSHTVNNCLGLASLAATYTRQCS